jgi:ATP-dependent RNA helicase DeaD
MASFNDLGLREPLLAALEEGGFERPTALQQAAIPVLRREGNLVARAGSGAGKTLAYGLGVLDRIEAREEADDEAGDEAEETTGTRVLVLAASPEHAERATLELVPLAQAVGLTVTASGRGWGTAAGEADILVATPAEVLEAVRTSGVKLESLEAIVVDGASEIEAMGGWEGRGDALRPRPARRPARPLQRRHDARRGGHDRPAHQAPPPLPAHPRRSRVGGAAERDGRLRLRDRLRAREAGDGGLPPGRRPRRRRAPGAGVPQRGARRAGGGGARPARLHRGRGGRRRRGRGGPLLRRRSGGDHGGARREPGDGDLLRRPRGRGDAARAARRGDDGLRPHLPRELAHLRQIAQRALLEPRPAGISGEEPAGRDDVRAFRATVRRAIHEEDISAQMLVLEPLFEDFTPAEVAAAVAALLRRKAPPAEQAAPAAPRDAPRARPAAAPAPERSTAGNAVAAYARLFVSIGERDGVRAGDLVGTIAGETDIPGSQIGKVDIRDTFSIVEVPAELAERVIAALNGTTIKGRSVRADHDRGSTRKPGGAGPRGAGGPPRQGGFGPRREDRGPRREGGGPPRDRGGAEGGFRRPPNRRPGRDE